MKSILLIAALVATAAGCGSTANYEAQLRQWTGKSEVELVRAWGPPQSSYVAGGAKFLTYKTRNSLVLPGVQPTYVANTYGSTTYVSTYGGSPDQTINLQCETVFEIVGEKVVRWGYRGNDCAR